MSPSCPSPGDSVLLSRNPLGISVHLISAFLLSLTGRRFQKLISLNVAKLCLIFSLYFSLQFVILLLVLIKYLILMIAILAWLEKAFLLLGKGGQLVFYCQSASPFQQPCSSPIPATSWFSRCCTNLDLVSRGGAEGSALPQLSWKHRLRLFLTFHLLLLWLHHRLMQRQTWSYLSFSSHFQHFQLCSRNYFQTPSAWL